MISHPGLPSPRLWIDAEVPPEIFGSTKYRKAIDAATKTPKPSARSRVMTTRGISSSSASRGCSTSRSSTGADVMRAPAPRAAGAPR